VLIGNASWETLDRVSREITNSVREINRVVWWCESEADAGKKEITQDFYPEAATITPARLKLAREADSAVSDVIRAHRLEQHIWQFPVILLPLRLGDGPRRGRDGGRRGTGGEVVVLRPVESREAMTARFYRMEQRVLDEILMKLEPLKGVSAVFYDVTNKPPATIEWE
jgi:GMP synthase (glutamine-hydrolysing)